MEGIAHHFPAEIEHAKGNTSLGFHQERKSSRNSGWKTPARLPGFATEGFPPEFGDAAGPQTARASKRGKQTARVARRPEEVSRLDQARQFAGRKEGDIA